MKKKSPQVVRLEALFKGEMNPRWRRDQAYFSPSLAGRRTCALSPAATQFLIDNIKGRNSKQPSFILIEPEGDIRHGGIQLFQDWFMAVKIALDEGVYIYNVRTKKCSRPVWAEGTEERTFENMIFEPVRLVPDQKTYDEKLPKVTSRLFAIGE